MGNLVDHPVTMLLAGAGLGALVGLAGGKRGKTATYAVWGGAIGLGVGVLKRHKAQGVGQSGAPHLVGRAARESGCVSSTKDRPCSPPAWSLTRLYGPDQRTWPQGERKLCYPNVDIFNSIQDRTICYPTKVDADNKTNGFPFPTTAPGGQLRDQGPLPRWVIIPDGAAAAMPAAPT